ncbi:cache domain-containing protein [Oxalobacteraceae bacterium]|nr:cache domain-containing protein [Oxalobacteraceae bacterium]
MNMIVKSIIAATATLMLSASLPASAVEKSTPEQAIAMVKKAADYVRANGKEKAFAEFNNPKGQFIERDLYIFAFLANGDGIERANGANLKLVGKNVLEMRDADGKFMIKDVLKLADTKGSGWVDYKWPNPVTGTIDAKRTYVEKVDDVVLGCGVYK